MRALFQILIGIDTQMTVENTMRSDSHQVSGGKKKIRVGNLTPIDCRRISSSTGAVTRMTPQSSWNLRIRFQNDLWSLVTKNGEKRQISSFGQTSRKPPPAKPQP